MALCLYVCVRYVVNAINLAVDYTHNLYIFVVVVVVHYKEQQIEVVLGGSTRSISIIENGIIWKCGQVKWKQRCISICPSSFVVFDPRYGKLVNGKLLFCNMNM